MALGWIDLAVVLAYFAVTIAIGLIAGRKERDTTDFFLGGRRQHWLLAGVSIIATEVSAVTLIAVPAEAFRGDWSYLQMYAGSFLGRVAIAFVLLPAFYGGAVTTVYQYLGQRFGPWTRTTASLMFFASRIIGSGIRLLIASLAVAEVFGWPLHVVVIASAGVAVVYAAVGGIKAILWTDAFQATLFVAAAFVAVSVIFLQTPGAWLDNLRFAHDAGKFHTFTWSGGWNNDKVFWLLSLNAFFTTMAALGTDQDMTQRMLTCANLRDGRRSLLFNAFAGLPIVCVFLLIGSLLFAHYASVGAGPDGRSTLIGASHSEPSARRSGFTALAQRGSPGEQPRVKGEESSELRDGSDLEMLRGAQHDDSGATLGRSLPADIGDRVFPYFIATAMPHNIGLQGLMIAAVLAAAMSSLSSAMGALATTAVTDLYRRAVCDQTEAHYLRAARVFTVVFGLILIFVALAFAGSQELLWAVFKWVGLVFGGMLGIFLLGVSTRTRGRDLSNVVAMLTSVAALCAVKYYQEHSGTVLIAWPWWVVAGTVWTYLAAGAFRRRPI